MKMRLIKKSILIYSAIVLLLIVGSNLIQFYYFNGVASSKIDHRLTRQKEILINQLKSLEKHGDLSYSTEYVKLEKKKCELQKDSLYNSISDLDGEEVDFRVLTSCVTIHGEEYQLTIERESDTSKDLLFNMILVSFVISLVFIVLLVIANFYQIKTLWKPFFTTLEALKKYNDTNAQNDLLSENYNTIEFNELNEEINELITKIKSDIELNQFYFDNLNHEILTPIAIIRGKLELILQSKSMEEKDLELISEIFKSLEKLESINRGLLLLSKIENNQFSEKSEIDLNDVLDESINNLEDYIQSKNLTLRKNITAHVRLLGNESLWEILINNLLKNAVFHNIDNGFVFIELFDDKLVITNSSANEETEANLFERFVKGSKKKESTGLGLSIVSKIAEFESIDVNYHFVSSNFVFEIGFKKTEFPQN